MSKTKVLVAAVIAAAALGSVYYFTGSSTEKSLEPVFVSKEKQISEKLLVDSVWAANRVFFDLKTVGDTQFVAYYDKNRMMTVASRKIGDKDWNRKTLPNKLEWDSHNLVTLGIDKEGYIHVSGNMHAVPMIYFRSTKPYDVQSMEQVKYMVGEKDEQRVTYPNFFNNADNELFYVYRSGGSGSGDIFVNKYNVEKKAWERYFSEALFRGINPETKETRSAYHTLTIDNDGVAHITWMWRWTPEVASCHQLSYVMSKDLKHWYNIEGKEVKLPLVPDMAEVIVDNVPSEGGLHNGKYKMILDKDRKPIIAYSKYDEKGFTQLYLTKFIDGKWMSKKISDWTFRWKFVGGGDKMTPGCNFSFVGFSEKGNLVIDWSNETGQKGVYVLSPDTFEFVNEDDTYTTQYPSAVKQKEISELNLQIKEDDTSRASNGVQYVLKWETEKVSHRGSAPKVIPDGPVVPLYLFGLK